MGSSSGTWRRVDDIKISLAGQVVADITPPKIQFNPFVTAYELTTLSFVIDWFINIGQYLQALSFLAIQQDYKCGYGWNVDITSTYTLTSIVPKRYYTLTSASLSSVVKTSRKVRTPLTSIPLGVSTIRRLNDMKVADIIAIVAQRFGVRVGFF